MGELVEVTAPGGRRLLLKRIPPLLLAGAVQVERFRREIRILVSLELEGVPRIEAFDDDPGNPYLLMEWVEGITLEDWFGELAQRPAEERLERVLRLGEDLALLLGEVHHVGIVHRDLTPRNVLVRPDGSPVLLDFGLSWTPVDSLLTQSGDFLGTLRYAPPEQVFASGRLAADRSGDLYSLGLILFEALAGRPVRDGGDSQEILRQALLEDPPDLRSVAPAVPRGVAAVVAGLLARHPRDRYPSGAEVARDLARCRADPAALRPPSPPLHRRLARSWRRW
ncbi:MAG: serine/threonine protein kinase, partial [Planctomycetota bacterium]